MPNEVSLGEIFANSIRAHSEASRTSRTLMTIARQRELFQNINTIKRNSKEMRDVNKSIKAKEKELASAAPETKDKIVHEIKDLNDRKKTAGEKDVSNLRNDLQHVEGQAQMQASLLDPNEARALRYLIELNKEHIGGDIDIFDTEEGIGGLFGPAADTFNNTFGRIIPGFLGRW